MIVPLARKKCEIKIGRNFLGKKWKKCSVRRITCLEHIFIEYGGVLVQLLTSFVHNIAPLSWVLTFYYRARHLFNSKLLEIN
jgi:hypothetical protein